MVFDNVPASSPTTRALGGFVDDVGGSINVMRERINGVVQFVETVTGMLKAVASLAGINAVLLLLGVVVISSITRHLGIPGGRAAFLLSLACTNALWVTWHGSFGPLDAAFAAKVVRTNLVVLAPFIAVALAARFWPKLGRLARRAVRRVFPGRERDSVEMAEELARLQDLHASFERALLRDIIDAGDGKVTISDGTRRLAAEVSSRAGELAGSKKAGE